MQNIRFGNICFKWLHISAYQTFFYQRHISAWICLEMFNVARVDIGYVLLLILQAFHNVMTNLMSITSYVGARKIIGHVRMGMDV